MIPQFARSHALLLGWGLLPWAFAGASCDRVAEPEGKPVAAPRATVASQPAADASAGSQQSSATASLGSLPSRCPVPLPPDPPPAEVPAAACPEPPAPPPRMPQSSVTFADAPGAPRVRVEVASTPDHRAHGLMYRQQLASGEGMLFSWEREQPRSFWMRNTCLPLDMLFIAEDGTVLGILEQVPPMNDRPRSIPCPAAHVLEVPAGWSRQHGVAPGQRLLIGER